MNTSVNILATHEKKQNGIRISDQLRLEWKPSQEPVAELHHKNESGIGCTHIRTTPGKSWVRLHVAIPKAPGTLIGARFLLKIVGSEGAGIIKPFPVVTKLYNDSRAEIAGAHVKGLPLQTGIWQEVTGLFSSGQVSDHERVDLVMNLPRGFEVFLCDVKVDTFGDASAEILRANPKTEILKEFQSRPVPDIAACAKMSPVYAHTVKLEHGAINGHLVTHAPAVFVSNTLTGTRTRVPLDKEGEFAGRSLLGGGFSVPLDPIESQQGAVFLFEHEQALQPFWSQGDEVFAQNLRPPRKATMPRERQDNVVLLWAPISTAGLTIQLEQVAKILKKQKFNFKISYHIQPRIDHPLCEYWIEPSDIDRPTLVIYFERFVAFDRGFDAAFKVFYMNLDWLSKREISLARTHADVVLCPTPYLLDDLSKTFSNSKVVHLPWPAAFPPRRKPAKLTTKRPLKVLYVGNDFDEQSRKHPFQVIEAIKRLKRDDIVFDLKFRQPLPPDLRAELLANPRVDQLIDWSTDHSVVESLYAEADINLIPNACEGNGLSILESWASGTIPAVLDGHPMKDVTSEQNSYRIACVQDGHQEYAPYYRTTADDILAFLEGLDTDAVSDKSETIGQMAGALVAREKKLAEAITSFALIAGMRTQGIRLRLLESHKSSKAFPDTTPRAGARVKELMFSDEGQSTFKRSPKHVDVMLTTSRRPWCLRESLISLLQAMRLSPFDHRLFVAIDTLDPGTLAVINEFSFEIDQVLWTKDRHGLPYTWNSLKDLLRNTINRSEIKPDYVCYIQDDCLIKDPGLYFEKMVGIASEAMPGYLGFVSGFYTEVHPGFADFDWKGNRVIASDSIDGKNFMATPEVLESIGQLTWWFKDGMRRGNPGPVRGSHFDLWQWKEAPNSLTSQYRISLILPDLCTHIAMRASDSTWNNDTTDEATQKRLDASRIYVTRS